MAKSPGRVLAGQIQGRKNVESGHLARVAPMGGRIAGPKVAKTNTASGQIQSLGRIQGRKNVESGQLARICSAGGRIAGRKAVESGHLVRLQELPQTKTAQRNNGRLQGRKNVESGHLARVRMMQANPSKEEIERLHKCLTGWRYNTHVDPNDEGSPIEVDAIRGKVIVFYDGPRWHGSEKQQTQDRRQRDRLSRAGYVVRSVFNRAVSEVEALQWNLFAEMR